MQGLRSLYEHTGRAVEWRRLVGELTFDLTDPATGSPLPGREQPWSMLTGYRVRIAQQARDWPAAQHLQEALISWFRQRADDLLSQHPESLSRSQRSTIRSLAAAILDLGQLRREQEQPGCVDQFLEAMKLFQRIGGRREEGTVAFNLGHAYKNISALRNLDQAEHWYRRDLELLEEHDTLGRAQTTGQLGIVAHERFLDARRAGEPAEQLARHLSDAADAFQQALDLLPPDAVDDLAVTHHQLGNIHDAAGNTDAALRHFQQAIQYQERQDNRYRAGHSRRDAALTLTDAGRHREALLYAQAALRDYQAVGPGASTDAEAVRQLIAQLQQDLPDESSSS
jgi:tetratricopeptide (TPR) repeat protein